MKSPSARYHGGENMMQPGTDVRPNWSEVRFSGTLFPGKEFVSALHDARTIKGHAGDRRIGTRDTLLLLKSLTRRFWPTTGRPTVSADELRCGGPLPEQNTPHQFSPEKAAVRDHAFSSARLERRCANRNPQFQNFVSGDVRHGAIRDFAQSEMVSARIIRIDAITRLLEVRLKKGLCSLTGGFRCQRRSSGHVLRYRNNVNSQQPPHIRSSMADPWPMRSIRGTRYLLGICGDESVASTIVRRPSYRTPGVRDEQVKITVFRDRIYNPPAPPSGRRHSIEAQRAAVQRKFYPEETISPEQVYVIEKCLSVIEAR